MSWTSPLTSGVRRRARRGVWAALGVATMACSSTPPVPVPVPSPSTSVTAAGPKAEPQANVLWKRPLGEAGLPHIDHLVTNAAGDLLLSVGTDGAVLLFRFDAAGHLVWQTSIETYRSWLGGAALDDEGNVYATAWFDTDVLLGGRTIASGVESVYLLKLDGAGKKAWSTVLRGNQVGGSKLFLGARGQLILAGNFGSDLQIGEVRLSGSSGNYSSISGNLFFAQFDTSGNPQWAREIPARAFITRMVVDGAGQILASGDFWGEAFFDASAPLKARKLPGDGRDHFLAKLDAAGKPRWTRHIEAAQMIPGPDTSGEVYIHAAAAGSNEIRKVSADGRILVKVALPDKELDCGDLTVDEKGILYVSARANDGPRDPKSGGQPLKPNPIVLQLDATGKVLSSVELLPDFYVDSPRLVWSKGRLFAAGITGTYQDPSFYLAEVKL